MAVGFRVLNSSDPRFYAPARDVAYIGNDIVSRAFHYVDTKAVDKIQKMISESKGDPAEYAVGLAEIAKGIADFLNVLPLGIEIEDAPTAFRFSNLSELQLKYPAAFTAVFASIGRMFISAVFNGTRDVTELDDPAYLFQCQMTTKRMMAQLAYAQLSWWKRALVRLTPHSLRKKLLAYFLDSSFRRDQILDSICVSNVRKSELLQDIRDVVKRAKEYHENAKPTTPTENANLSERPGTTQESS